MFTIKDTLGHGLTQALEMHYVELAKLVWSDEKMGDALSRWGRFLTAKSREEMEVLAVDDPVMKKAVETLEYLSQDPEVREQYWQRQKGIQTYLTDMAGERRKGREEGLKEAARRLLLYGMRLDRVCEVTGIALEELRRLDNDAGD